MKKQYQFLLFGIIMMLLAIFCAVFLQYTDSYFFVVLVIAAPVIGVLFGIAGLSPSEKRELIPKKLELRDFPQYENLKTKIKQIKVIWHDGDTVVDFIIDRREDVAFILEKLFAKEFLLQTEQREEGAFLELILKNQDDKDVSLDFSKLEFDGWKYYDPSSDIKDRVHKIGVELGAL